MFFVSPLATLRSGSKSTSVAAHEDVFWAVCKSAFMQADLPDRPFVTTVVLSLMPMWLWLLASTFDATFSLRGIVVGSLVLLVMVVGSRMDVFKGADFNY